VAAQEVEKNEEEVQEGDIVTGTEVIAASDKGIDYQKLVKDFGCFNITPELIT